jgi:ribose transport system substrate-binding protein
MATLAGYGLLGKDAPPFVTGELVKVKRDNLEQAWRQSLNKPLPREVAQALGG